VDGEVAGIDEVDLNRRGGDETRGLLERSFPKFGLQKRLWRPLLGGRP
jgi:hypothetical protein